MLFYLFLLWVMQSPVTGEKLQAISTPLTACDLLENIPKYRGMIVEVRAEFGGAFLKGNCKPLKTGTHTWPNVIILDTPESLRESEPPANWRADKKGWDEAIAEMQQLFRKAGPDAIIEATVVGRFDSPASLEVVTGEFSTRTTNGYGHLNQYPARLVVASIRNVALGRNQPTRP
jgi:hypothetical protein